MELVLDSVIIILITVLIIYSVVLNIKLKTFRSARDEMAGLISQLNEAVTRAQTSVEILKKTALTEEGRLKELITKSRLLADELEIITQSGANLANRIERGLIPAENIPEYQNFASEDEEAGDEEENEMLETLKKVR